MKNKLTNLWMGIYPVIIYWAVINILYSLLGLTGLLNLLSDYPMLIQAIIKGITLMPMLYFYRHMGGRENSVKNPVVAGLLVILIGGLLALSLNELVALSPLKEMSKTYTSVSNTMYGDKWYFQLLVAGFLAPVLEEITFRGICYSQFKKALGFIPAVFLSAITFGAMHNNLVQFVYAGLMGIVFALIYEKASHIWPVILCHMAANIICLYVTWQKLDLVLFPDRPVGMVVALVMMLVGLLVLQGFRKSK